MKLPRHYLQFPDGFILVYDPCEPASLDMLAGIKNDIDKNKDKKDVSIQSHEIIQLYYFLIFLLMKYLGFITGMRNCNSKYAFKK